MSTAINLANWVRANLTYRKGPLTHLKLQKLVFYCFGGALAFGVEGDVGGNIVFEAWEHGPVNRDVWQEFRQFKGQPIPEIDPWDAPSFSERTESVLSDVLTLYGLLDAWSLRQESHLEAPWLEAWRVRGAISSDGLRAHFKKKLAGDHVAYPHYLLEPGSLLLDGIPTGVNGNLRQVAETLRSRILS
jgi:uncharacterized phage-associated protein